MARAQSTHEDFERLDAVKGSSDRAFGLVFTAFFLIVGFWPLWRGAAPRPWALGLGALFLAVSLINPRLLAPLNRLWLFLGLALHSVVSPLVLGLLYYTTVTPIGLVMRLVGKDPLRLRFDPDAPTYWLERRPPGPAAETMRRQF
jgi:hypothetical protein